MPSTAPRTHVVTGASRGIGRAIAAALVADGHHVVLLCRDSPHARATHEALAASAPTHAADTPRVELVFGDLSTAAATRAAADALLAACPHIHVLVHNAGLWPTRLEHNADGLEQAFAVNALAPFLLSHLLEARLADSRARVVQVSAGLAVKGRVDVARTPTGDDFHRIRTYATTKLWNLVLTLEHARRLEARGAPITVTACHPGVIRTDLGAMGGPLGLLLSTVKRFWATPEEGARAPVHLATSPDLDGVTGAYFDQRTRAEPAPAAADRDLAAAVWDRTATLAGLYDAAA